MSPDVLSAVKAERSQWRLTYNHDGPHSVLRCPIDIQWRQREEEQSDRNAAIAATMEITRKIGGIR